MAEARRSAVMGACALVSLAFLALCAIWLAKPVREDPDKLMLGDRDASLEGHPWHRNSRRVVKYDWTFTINRQLDPDCYGGTDRHGNKRQHITCNGQFPGPEVRVEQGDIVEVHVTNLMVRKDQGHNIRQGMTVHWHGLQMRGKQWYDGVGYVTQCPIGFNQSFTYVIDTADEAPGTHWWHAHMGLDMQDGMFGAFVILPRRGTERPKGIPPYDEELPVMLIHGWWNHSGDSMEWGLSRQYPYWVGNPQSLLVNGKGLAGPGWLPGDRQLPAAPCNKKDVNYFSRFFVEPGKSYLLRIVAAGALLPYNLTIPGHSMTVVQAGGVWLQPTKVDSLMINLGQRYSVVLEASGQTGTNYPMVVSTWGRQAASPECTNELAPLVGNPDVKWGGPMTLKDFCTGANVNYRLPAAQAVLSYVGAGDELDSGYTGVNWYQSLTNEERDKMVRVGIETQMFKPLPPSRGQGSFVDGYNPPVPRAERGQKLREPIDMLFNVWWPGQLPPETAKLVGPGMVSAPEDAEWFRWAVYNISFSEVGSPLLPTADKPRVPFLAQSLMEQGGTKLDASLAYNLIRRGQQSADKQFGAAAFDIEYGEVVDLVLNNDDPTEVHPWHLHGHCFHVLGMGEGRYEPKRDRASLNEKDALCVDTVTVMYKSWAYLRFVAKNPGVWFMHCHMEAHLVLGMGNFFRVKNAPASVKEAGRVNVKVPPALDFLAPCPAPVDSSWNAEAYSGPSSQYLPYTNARDDPGSRPWEDPSNYFKASPPMSRPVAVMTDRSRHRRRHHH